MTVNERRLAEAPSESSAKTTALNVVHSALEKVTSAPQSADRAAVETWVHRVYGELPGALVVAHANSDGRFEGTGGGCRTPEAAVERIMRLDARRAQSIYLRTTTLNSVPPSGRRGSAQDSNALPGLWADVDYGDIGHAHNPMQQGGLVLPPDAAEARRIVQESGLPDPTLWVNSGGGMYPWWLFDEVIRIEEGNFGELTRTSSAVQEVLARSAQRLGYFYGAGVGDLARVLRVPGTINRKEGLERPCFLDEDDGPEYHLSEMTAALSELAGSLGRGAPLAEVSSRVGPPAKRQVAHRGPFDEMADQTSFEDILFGAGWTICGNTHPRSVLTCFTRPGEAVSNPCSAHVLRAQPETLIVWSETSGLPTGAGRKLTKARLFAHLWHGGDERAAAQDLHAALRGDPCTDAARALGLTAPQASTPSLRRPAAPPVVATLADRDRYIDRRDGLQVATLAADVATEAGPFALGPGDTLWPYRDGVYVNEGDAAVRASVPVVRSVADARSNLLASPDLAPDGETVLPLCDAGTRSAGGLKPWVGRAASPLTPRPSCSSRLPLFAQLAPAAGVCRRRTSPSRSQPPSYASRPAGP